METLTYTLLLLLPLSLSSATSTLPACYTWVISTSASTDKSVELYTILGCSLQPGKGTLLTVDPAWLATHSFGSTTTAATTTSTESSSPLATSTPDSSGGNSSTPVGAIAGGAVGGVAALGLVGLAAFLLSRHRNPRNNAPAAGQPPQGQNHAAGGAVYPLGVPAGYQAGYAPVPMQQQGYYPQQFAGQYPPQQQQHNYHYSAQTASTSPVHTTPSPGAFKDGETSASELPTTSPLGAETNRAELGGGN